MAERIAVKKLELPLWVFSDGGKEGSGVAGNFDGSGGGDPREGVTETILLGGLFLG